jgi:hypothetical protein
MIALFWAKNDQQKVRQERFNYLHLVDQGIVEVCATLDKDVININIDNPFLLS